MARFAHTHDAPHVLRHIEAYLTAFMAQFDGKPRVLSFGRPGVCSSKDFLDWAVMANRLDMLELRGHCERALVMCWGIFQDRPNDLDKLSRSAFRRIAKGLNKALLASEKRRSGRALVYPTVGDMIAWGRHE